MDDVDYKEGELVVFEEGEYSDKSWSGPFKVMRDCNLRDEAAAYKAQFEAENEWDRPNPSGFMAYLNRTGVIADEPARWHHIGCYGDLEIA